MNMIETSCVYAKKNTVNENSNVRKTMQNRFLMVLSNGAIFGKKKSSFIKNQQLH